jgi:caa(3)-type oxidase subunit IV
LDFPVSAALFGLRPGAQPPAWLREEIAMAEHDLNGPIAKPAHHGPNFQAYMFVFYALSALTAVSFLSNWLVAHAMGLEHLSMVIILAVAVVKATLVAVIFMHLKFDWPKVYCIIIPVCVMGVMMMIVLLPDIVISWHHYLYK